jgi:hypothetical protein
MADLPRAGRELFTWPIESAPVGLTFEASVGGNWVPAGHPTVDTLTLLLEGPDVALADRDPAAVVLPRSERIEFRVKDDPEIIIRGRGSVRLI